MRDRSKLLIVFCIFFEVSSLYSISLTTTFQDAPPKYIDGERVSGIAFDILTSISKDLKNYDIDITWDGDFRNMGEIQKLLQDCKIDFFIGMAKTPERQKQLIFSKVPIYSINSLLLLKRGAREATKAKIGVISSTKTSKNLPKSIKDSAEILEIGNVDRAINLLLDGELDGVFYNSMSLGYYYLKHKDLLEPVLMFSRKYYQYVVFSKCVNSEVMNMVDKVLKKMIKDGEVEKIIKKYDLENFVKPPNEISIAVLSSAPYSYSDSDIIEGIEIDILRKVFKDIGYSVNFYIMNYKRALEYVKRGIMDGVVPVLKEDSESVYLSGEPLEKRIIGYAVLKNSVPKKIQRCGYAEEVLKEIMADDKNCQWIMVPDFKKGMMMLSHKRIDRLLIDELSFKYYSKILKTSEIEFIPKDAKLTTYVGFSNSDDYYEYLKNRFSEELKEYKTSGEYTEVLNKYGISYKDLWAK